jgi:hypothetical protein
VGHKRLGVLPDTVPWRKVVGLLAEAADAPEVAGATMQAANLGFEAAKRDDGFSHIVWLLSHTVLASREPDLSASLRAVGINVGENPSIYDLVGGFSDAVDSHFDQAGCRTDFGEMAQMAAVESLSHSVSQRAAGLFGTSSEELQRATRELSTRSGFSALAHEFFSRFVNRFLTYHLSRELSLHCGANGRFSEPSEHNEFLTQLRTLSRQAALIVRDFSGGWYSRAHFENGISRTSAKRFADHALTKLGRELAFRGRRGG